MGNKTLNEYVRLDYEQSLFFLVLSRKSPCFAAPHSRARALISLNLRKRETTRSLTLDKLREVTFLNKVTVELHGVVFFLSVRSPRKLRMHDIEYGRRQSGRAFRALDL